MKLVIFGASGRTGIPLVRQALAEGHAVVAFVRSPSKLPIQHERLTVVSGDAMNAADVEKAVIGADVVISALGHGKGTPDDMQTVATRHIITAMEKHGVRRFISLTGAGVVAPQDQPKPINHLIRFALKTLSGKVLKDAEGHADIIQRSTLDWTIVRGPMLTENPGTGKYRVGWVGVNTSARIAREDLARFMLAQAADRTYLRQMPMVSE